MTSIEPRLILVIGAPRSGTTLLMRMLNAHSQIYSRPEPHLLGPLAHLGYYAMVDKAPYDQHQAASAIRELVEELPGGEQDYLDACRAYVDTLYGRLLEARGGGKHYFVDKTPANALVLPFLCKLMPRARYVVLTRHPAAVFSSYANSFFEGDYAAAAKFNPILSRYVPAIGRLLREQPVELVHVRYETLVREPASELQRLCRYLDLSFEAGMIDYGDHALDGRGLGDPTQVERHSRPVSTYVDRWAGELAASTANRAIVAAMLDSLDDRDLEAWGYPRVTLWRPLEEAGGSATPAKGPWDRFRVQRAVLRWLRRDNDRSAIGRVARRVRDLCDLMLR